MLTGKKILLGITGSIAAYKAILLVRLLVKAGAEVKIIVTPAARDFVPILALSTLSKNKVLINLADEDTWANHVMLGRWADAMIIAPLSCNTLSKMATGACDNLLLAAYLSAVCPVLVAPAMDEDMWHHPSVQGNINKLIGFGNKVISVNKGELASGLFGEGRMAEPNEIISYLSEHIFRGTALRGRKALVTAGPTYEALDPVRFIGNHSSGKMGYAIATELYLQGADVYLVSGPTMLTVDYAGIKVDRVHTAAEMFEACTNVFNQIDIAVMSAAVADYTPANVSAQKIKKKNASLQIELTQTKDILKHLGSIKKQGQLLVGFALETENEKVNAIQKLKSKNADFIVLNSMNDKDAGFGKDSNKITVFDRHEQEFAFEAKSKQLVAKDIVDIIIKNVK